MFKVVARKPYNSSCEVCRRVLPQDFSGLNLPDALVADSHQHYMDKIPK